MVRKWLAAGALAVCVALAGGGCVSKTATVQTAKAQLAAGGAVDSKLFESDARAGDKDAVWAFMERGRLRQLTGDWEGSCADYEAAARECEALDARAVASLSGAASQGAALLTNDQVIPYEGETYERVMLYTLDAFNRAALGRPEEIGVDVRNAADLLEAALDAHGKKGDEFREGNAETRTQTEKTMDSDEFKAMTAAADSVAGSVANSFQSAYTYALAGTWYEARDMWGDAAIAFGRAYKLQPQNKAFAEGMRHAAARSGKTVKGFVPPKPGEGWVTVFLEQGYNVQKQPFTLPLLLPHNYVQASIPFYDCSYDPEPVIPGSVWWKGRKVAETQEACDYRVLAVKALQERLPGILARQIARSIAKGVINEQVRKRDPTGLAGLAVVVGNALTEQADLRSWQLMPRHGQVARFRLPEGEYALEVEFAGGRTTVQATVRAGRPTVLHVSCVPGVLRVEATAL